MSITIECPSCGATLRVPETSLGKLVRCPKCEERFTAEDPADQPEPDAPRRSLTKREDPPPSRRRDEEEDDRDRPSRRRDEEDDDRDRPSPRRDEEADRPSRWRDDDDDRPSRRRAYDDRSDRFADDKPPSVQTGGVLLLCGGIVALLGALVVMFVDVVGTAFICCLYPGYVYAFVSGILAIIHGSSLMGANARRGANGRAAAIMLIINLVNFDVLSATLGIIALVMLNNEETTRYFRGGGRY